MLPARCCDVVSGFCCLVLLEAIVTVLAQIVRPGVSRDPIYPRDEAVRLLVRLPVFQNADKYVVDEVFAGHAISGETAEEVVERLAISEIQNLELIEIA